MENCNNFKVSISKNVGQVDKPGFFTVLYCTILCTLLKNAPNEPNILHYHHFKKYGVNFVFKN
jgi:hypothetical protein